MDRFSRIRQLCLDKYKNSIVFRALSFEEFVQALQRPHLPKNLADAIEEFRAYLDEQNLLPQWERWLDVVNCAGFPDDVLKGGVYLCPAAGGAYNHYRCQYFGMYCDKRIEKVALIEAVVDVEGAESAIVKWHNIRGSEEDFKKRAQAKLAERRPGNSPTRVFLLGPLQDTDCQKESRGGMQNSKQYWDIASLRVGDAQELARAMTGKTWAEVRVLQTL